MMLALLPVAVLVLAATASVEGQSIYGAYQDCPFHCRTIKINRNHTFVYRLNGDLYNDERDSGTWTLVGRNKVHASSPLNRSRLQVAEERGNASDDLLVTVLDQTSGGTVKGAVISAYVDGRRISATTDDSGFIHIARCREFRLAYRDYRGRHRIRDLSARRFTVTLTFDQLANWAINETWLVEGNRLYIAGEDGTFDRTSWLDRLSNRQARKIFH
jgi:hypothetical protein